MRISVAAKARAKKEYVKKTGEGQYAVAVSVVPEKGRANAAIATALAAYSKTITKLPICCNRAVSAAPSSVLVSVYSSYTPFSSVLGSLETAQFRYEMEFCDGLFDIAPSRVRLISGATARQKVFDIS
jgi:uncharacterized protein YggU (UPF0235/DUF167 family)